MFSFFLFIIYLVLVGTIFFNKHSKWWIKVCTQIPVCTYYFGPFDSVQEAESNYADYLQDLQEEEAQGISYAIEQSCPQQLTITEDDPII